MHDTLYNDRKCRSLNVIDEANSECLTIECGALIPWARPMRAWSA